MRKNTDNRGVFPFINKKTVYGFLIMAVILLIEMNIIFFISTSVQSKLITDFGYKNMLENEKKDLKSSVDNTVKDIDSTRVLLEKKGMTDEQVKESVQERVYAKIHSDEYLDGRYMWVNEIIDYNGGDGYAIRLIHPNLPETEGQLLSTNTRDKKGNYPYRQELDIVNGKGSGFYNYYFKELDSNKVTEKITYARVYKRYNWVICEGENLNSIRVYEKIQKERMKPYLIGIDIIMSVVCLLIILLTTGSFITRFNKILMEKNRELKEEAHRDSLTRIFNRGGLIYSLDRLIDDETTAGFTGVFMDLDEFKLINDVYGHNTGDAALRHMAASLKEFFPDNSIIGRTGGDEFCVIIKDEDPEKCGKMIQDFASITKSFESEGRTIIYKVSAGYADYPSQAGNREELMIMMDNALYASKTQGKNCAMHYKPEMENIKREQLGFSVKNMTSGMPGAFLVYSANESERILFANDHLVSLYECDSYDEFLQLTKSSFKYMIHPDDRERVEKSIKDQIEKGRKTVEEASAGLEDYVEYRIVTKTGKIRRVMDNGRLVHDDHHGDIYYVIIQDVESMKEYGYYGKPD